MSDPQTEKQHSLDIYSCIMMELIRGILGVQGAECKMKVGVSSDMPQL